MILKEKERAALEDLQTQEKSCVEKYEKYANQARDPELKSLFQTSEGGAEALRFSRTGTCRNGSGM